MKIVIGLVSEDRNQQKDFSYRLREMLWENGHRYNPFFMEFLEPVEKTLKDYQILNSADNISKLTTLLDTVFGIGTVSKGIRNKIENNFFSEIIVVGGIKGEAGIGIIKSFSNGFIVRLKNSENPKEKAEKLFNKKLKDILDKEARK
ncbi:MAG: hypothetical protein AAB646_00135 [Patescibacteria group bacterium]